MINGIFRLFGAGNIRLVHIQPTIATKDCRNQIVFSKICHSSGNIGECKCLVMNSGKFASMNWFKCPETSDIVNPRNDTIGSMKRISIPK
jgi:hypothetical protein